MVAMTAMDTADSQPAPPMENLKNEDLAAIVIKEEPKDAEEADMELTIQMAMSSALHSHAAAISSTPTRMRYRYTNTRSSELPDTPVCEVCQSELPNQKLLTLHKLCHFNTRHVCYVCDGYFTQSDTLALHMATTHRNLNNFAGDRDALVCPVCLQRFSNKMSFKNHQTQHTLKDSTTSVCRVCGLSFTSPRGLVAHLNSPRHREMKVKMQSVFVCVDCRAIFATRDSYAMHMMMRAQSESCTPLKYSSMDVLDTSLKDDPTRHANLSDMLTSNNNTSTMPTMNTPINLTKDCASPEAPSEGNQCHKCRAAFASQDALALHVMMHSQADGFPGALPQVGNSPTSALQMTSGQNQPTLTSFPTPWNCNRCMLNFDSCDTLAMHMMTRHANESGGYSGELPPGLQHLLQFRQAQLMAQLKVGATFEDTQKTRSLDLSSPASVKSDLTTQRRPTHEALGKRPASVGTNVPASKSQKMGDSGNRMWECWECKDTFPNQTLWLEHIFNCSRLKLVTPQCEVCNAEFADFQSLRDHLETSGHHEGTKEQHICSGCGWTTTEQEALLQHKAVCVMCRMPPELNLAQKEVDMSIKTNAELEPGERIAAQDDQSVDYDNSSHKDTVQLRRPHSTPNDIAHKEGELGYMKIGQSYGQFPESSTSQDELNLSGSERSQSTPAAGVISQSGIAESDEGGEGEIIDFVLSRSSDLAMCKHCNIVYLDRTMYYLHMGLHNLNNPWQCNMCGKACRDKHEFTSHVIHYQ